MIPAARRESHLEDLIFRASSGIVSGLILANVISPLLGTFSMTASRAILQHGRFMIFGGTVGGYNGIQTSRETDRVKKIATALLLTVSFAANAALDYYAPIRQQISWATE